MLFFFGQMILKNWIISLRRLKCVSSLLSFNHYLHSLSINREMILFLCQLWPVNCRSSNIEKPNFFCSIFRLATFLFLFFRFAALTRQQTAKEYSKKGSNPSRKKSTKNPQKKLSYNFLQDFFVGSIHSWTLQETEKNR